MNKRFYNGEEEVINAICGHCGRTHHWDEDSCAIYQGKLICNECFQELFGFCDECDTLHLYSDMNDVICKTCQEKLSKL